MNKEIREQIKECYERSLYKLYLDNAKNIPYSNSKHSHFFEFFKIGDNSEELKEILDFYEYKYFLNKERKIIGNIDDFCKDYITRNNSFRYIGYEFTSYEIKNTISNLEKRNTLPDLIFGSDYYKISNIKDFIKNLCLGLCNESGSLVVEERGFFTNAGKQLLYSEYLKRLANSDLTEDEYAFISCENTTDFQYKKYLEFFCTNISTYELIGLIEKHILTSYDY